MISHRRQQEVFGGYSRNWVGGCAAPRIGIQKVPLKNQNLDRIRLRAVDDCLEMRKRSDEAVLRDREIFRRILVSLLIDTERRHKDKLLELKKAAEEIQKLQLWLAKQIQELEDEYERVMGGGQNCAIYW